MCLEYRTPSGISGLPCSVIKVNGKQQRQLRQNYQLPRLLREWRSGSPPQAESQPAQLLAKGKGGPERVVEEGSYKPQLWPGNQFQK